MANPTQNGVLKKDDNGYPVMGGTSSADNATVVNSSFDVSTRRLQVTSSGSGQVLPYVAKTATYAVGVNDYVIEATSGTFTVTLPTAIGITGRIYVVKNTGAGTITVATTGGQTIDGGATVSLTQNLFTMVQSNGANWIVI